MIFIIITEKKEKEVLTRLALKEHNFIKYSRHEITLIFFLLK